MTVTSESIGTAAIQPARRRALPWHRRAWFDLLLFTAGAGLLLWFTIRGAQGMGYEWRWHRVPGFLYRVVDGEVIWGPLSKGLLVTLNIAWIGMLLTLAIGLITALLRLSPSRVGRFLAGAYLEAIRNTPLLVQVLIFYFILGPIFGIPRLWAGILALSFYEGTFAAEIIRGAVLSVPRGQWEAGSAMGLARADLYRFVVLPQAVPLMIPPMTGVLVNLVKHSAIVSVIAVADLATEARNLVSDTFMPFEVWLTAAAIYLVITISLSMVAALLEKGLARRR